MNVINTIAPVFLVMAVGAILRRMGFLSAEFVKRLMRLVYWVGLPCLLFYKTAGASYDYQAAGKTFLVVLSGMIACIIAGYVAAFLLRVEGRAIGTFVQGAFRGNLMYVGLTIIIYSFTDSGGFDVGQMETIAVLVLAFIVPLYNIAAVVILLASRHKIGREALVKTLRPIVTNPLLLACIAGILYSVVFPGLPQAVSRTCAAVGQMALPLALLGIGATLVEKRVFAFGQGFLALGSSVIKVVVAPATGLAVARLLGLGPGETRIALLFLACPTAISSYVLADQLGGDKGLSAAIVVLSVLLSMVSLSVVVGLY